jgi:hypothetical protein
MSCERTLPLLPLVALDSADAADRTAVLDHVAGCASCAEALRELEAARASLASFTVEEAPATDAVAIRAEADDDAPPVAPRLAAPPRRFSGFAKAAAALLVGAAALGFAFLHGELTVEQGGATLRIAWRAPAPVQDGLAPAPDAATSVTPEYLAAALDELARHLSDLETRHERELLLLADAVDRQQRQRDRGVDRRSHSPEQQTRDGFIFTNEVLDHVVDQLAQPDASASVAPNQH